jgi:hypothetical protein
MKVLSPLLLWTLAGAVVFNLVFWQENPGVNMLIFSGLMVTLICHYYPDALKHKMSLIVLGCHLVSLGLVVINGPGIGVLSAVSTLFLFAAFAEHAHRSVAFAAGTMLLQGSVLIRTLREQIRFGASTQPGLQGSLYGVRKSGRWRLIVLPVFLLMFFLWLYLMANKGFAALWVKTFESLIDFIAAIFERFPADRLLFMIPGAFIAGTLIIKSSAAYFSRKESTMKDVLTRRRVKPRPNWIVQYIADFAGSYGKGVLALKHKNTIGLISFLFLNVLLLIVNITDLNYIWFGDAHLRDNALSDFVHEGTGTLIFSILMAIAVVLMFFDGNLNFYKKNKGLKIAGYTWIIQNIFLVASVFMRDYYYISHHGLAYKRIGVLFFLCLVLVGLTSVIIKISARKSGYFLFRVNSNAILVLLLAGAIVNWDVMIAKYNIANIEKIQPDVPFLLNLSEQTLPVIIENKSKLARYMSETNLVPGVDSKSNNLDQIIELKKQRFMNEYKKLSWLSFNMTDHATFRYLVGEQPALGLVDHSTSGKNHRYER